MRSFVECIWTFWSLINYDNILPLPACPCNAWSGSQGSFYDIGNVRTAAKVWLVAIDRVHITVLHSQWLLEQLPNTTDMPTHSASCAVLLRSDKEGVMQDNYSQALNKSSQSLLYVYIDWRFEGACWWQPSHSLIVLYRGYFWLGEAFYLYSHLTE